MGYPSPGPKGRRWLAQLAGDRRLHISTAISSQGEIIAYHAYCREEKRVRMYHASSMHQRFDDKARRALFGRDNRELFWHDMLWFKERGLEWFYFGGWSTQQAGPQRMRVNCFKESFGGQVKIVYTSSQGQTLLGTIAVWLHSTLVARCSREVK